jgi:Uncharacterized protein conserved in bacteria (DUF2255)
VSISQPIQAPSGHLSANAPLPEIRFLSHPKQIDAAYRTKYRRYAASIIRSIVRPEAQSATIKLGPRSTSSYANNHLVLESSTTAERPRHRYGRAYQGTSARPVAFMEIVGLFVM